MGLAKVITASCALAAVESAYILQRSGPQRQQQQQLTIVTGAASVPFAFNVAEARSVGGKPIDIISQASNGLQDIVTWDEHSIFVHGERVMLYSGEFHPFRLPVATLWLDVFQKIRALGYNCVSFYVDWALLEGNPGDFRAEGIFSLEPFFDAATKAGIYLVARPGPYINAEVSGGGFPGWLQREVPGYLRTYDETFLASTTNYVDKVTAIIAKAQITNGGPVILFQPENEYQGGDNEVYFSYVRDQFLNRSIVVPLINNDANALGNQAPGTPGAVDIYAHDGYPLGFDCANPTFWPGAGLPTTWRDVHLQQSPYTPYSVLEFQGGAFDPWGGPGFDNCEALLSQEFERVFYKNLFSFGVTIFNVYMTYGGTNWGNLGHPGGYTSYDYAAVIREDRRVDREKYSEAKLLANFIQASPAYLTANTSNITTGVYAPDTLAVTPLRDDITGTGFYVVRQSDYTSQDTVNYKVELPTSAGNITIPQSKGQLSLHGRDSKVFVTDYNIGGVNLLYSTAEIFTWKKYSSKTVLVVYSGPGETNEFAFASDSGRYGNGHGGYSYGWSWRGFGSQKPTVIEGSDVTIQTENNAYVVNFDSSSSRRVVQYGSVLVYILDRNSAYDYWTLPSSSGDDVIVKAGYLLRTAAQTSDTLALVGDFNQTTSIEVIGAPDFSRLSVNGQQVAATQNKKTGSYSATVTYSKPKISLPTLSTLTWYQTDSLPELNPSYSDAQWTTADRKTTNNTHRKPLLTPTVLFSSDYGYHAGSVIYRGHFTSNGGETSVQLWTEGGSAFGMSAWLDDTFLGSFGGYDWAMDYNSTFDIPASAVATGQESVLTVLIDNMGLNENWAPSSDTMKEPRGIINYTIDGHAQSDVAWKLTGNLHGEDYVDKTRGPLNEGALYAERQGYHQPYPPVTSDGWTAVAGGPLKGIDRPGVRFYTTSFDLDLPRSYDIPLSFVFNNGTETDGNGRAIAYRAQLWVNGYQFGKYVHNVGPQDEFSVPEGILNYHGTNWVAVSLWAQEDGGARLTGLDLVADAVILTGMEEVVNSPMPKWQQRDGAY